MTSFDLKRRHLAVAGLVLAASLLHACSGNDRAPSDGKTTTAVATAASGTLPVIDSTGMACTELIVPGDSLPPRIDRLIVGPSGMLAWQPTGMPIIVIRKADGTEVRIDGRAKASFFVRAAQMGWLGDTLWMTDAESNRIHRFTLDGKNLGIVLTPVPGPGWVLRPDGTLRATALRGFSPEGTSDSTWALIGGKTTARRIDTITSVPSPAWQAPHLAEGPGLNPLSIATVAQISPDGSRWCATTIESGADHLRCFRHDGSLEFDHALALTRRPLTDSLYQSVLKIFTTPRQNNLDTLRNHLDRPAFLPTAVRMRIGHDQSIWFMRSLADEAVQVWARLGHNASAEDELHLARNWYPLDFAGDTLWVRERNDVSLDRVLRCVIR